MNEHRPEPDDPTHIGEYEVLGRLGAGGMGVVYLARSRSGRRVAVKVVHEALARDAAFRGRFRDEVARARQVPPFCTAEVLDADPEAPQPYLVVEYVEGPTLADEVAAKGPLTPSNLHGLAIGVATALTAIHEAGVIHRDLKPSNVLLAPGSPKVIDFGIARAMEAQATDGHTRTGQLFGTISYMAPERFDGPARAITPAADIFAWGCVVAYAGTGQAPFEAGSAMATFGRIMSQPPMLDGMAEGPLRTLVERALSVDPEQRPTARDLLAGLLGSGPVTVAAPAVTAAKPRPRLLVPALLLLVIALVGGAGFALHSNTDPPAPIFTEPAAAPAAFSASPSPASTTASASASPSLSPSASPSPSRSKKPKATKTAAPKRTNQPPVESADGSGASAYGPYFIHNLATGECVDLPGSGPGVADQAVYQHSCVKTGEDNQEWEFVPHGIDADGDQLYWIRNVDDGLCLDVPGADPVPSGTEVTETNCFEVDNQDYRLQPQLTSGGWEYYRLVNTSSNLCLDVLGVRDTAEDVRLSLSQCVTGDDHEWALVEKSEW
ncbi:serine/threonine protein kinase [Actinoplanes sp. NPDC051851]|uniref:serine/threonine protein kinase n=1 Tax=Actinoplanes sp. NPDC051851 TaxID=3154753 RepID=UPI003423107F